MTRKQDRQDRIAKARAEIAELNQDAASATKSRQLEPLRNKVAKMLSRLKLTQILEPALDEVLMTRNAEKGSKPLQTKTFGVRLVPRPEAANLDTYDGLYCLCTSVPESKFSTEQAVEAYRRKTVVEEALALDTEPRISRDRTVLPGCRQRVGV